MITEKALIYQAGRMGFIVNEADTAKTIREQMAPLFPNGQFVGKVTQNGVASDAWDWGCNGCGPHYNGTDNVRDHVDVYVSRTHTQIYVNGNLMVDKTTPDLGFDRAYVYLEHVNYNSCKGHVDPEGLPLSECQLAGNTFHWDNVAFDGPTLPVNGLTPLGSKDIVFNAYNQASCSVKGVAATPVVPYDPNTQQGWLTWVARVAVNTSVTPADVVCVDGAGGSSYRGTPMGFEIVQQ